ncbi:GIY-YIG nuclease family protein [Flavobacterium pedocola]
MYYVYILYLKSLDVYYKGFTSGVEGRLESHLLGLSTYTSRAKDWELVYKFGYESKKAAIIEEKRIKKLNRASLERMISG